MTAQGGSLEIINDFLAQKRIAMVGISREPRNFSVSLFQELCRRGYDMVPVNPNTPNDGVRSGPGAGPPIRQSRRPHPEKAHCANRAWPPKRKRPPRIGSKRRAAIAGEDEPQGKLGDALSISAPWCASRKDRRPRTV